MCDFHSASAMTHGLSGLPCLLSNWANVPDPLSAKLPDGKTAMTKNPYHVNQCPGGTTPGVGLGWADGHKQSFIVGKQCAEKGSSGETLVDTAVFCVPHSSLVSLPDRDKEGSPGAYCTPGVQYTATMQCPCHLFGTNHSTPPLNADISKCFYKVPPEPLFEGKDIHLLPCHSTTPPPKNATGENHPKHLIHSPPPPPLPPVASAAAAAATAGKQVPAKDMATAYHQEFYQSGGHHHGHHHRHHHHDHHDHHHYHHDRRNHYGFHPHYHHPHDHYFSHARVPYPYILHPYGHLHLPARCPCSSCHG